MPCSGLAVVSLLTGEVRTRTPWHRRLRAVHGESELDALRYDGADVADGEIELIGISSEIFTYLETYHLESFDRTQMHYRDALQTR